MIKQISPIVEDQSRIAAIYGPQGKDIAYEFFLRGVRVERFDITRTNARGQVYRLCRFPDGGDQWVNEGNLDARRRPDRFHFQKVNT